MEDKNFIKKLDEIDKKLSTVITTVDNLTQEKGSNVINCFSRKIAESLCVDYGYFNNLIEVRPNKKNKTRLVYVFTKTGNIENDFKKLVAEAKQFTQERMKQEKEVDKAIRTENSDTNA